MSGIPMLFRLALCLACLTAIPLRASDPASESGRLRVLTYNIHHGRGIDGNLNLPRIAGVIQSVEPDLVALQEVDQTVQRSGSVDQPAELARLTGMQVVFGGNITLQGGEYGNAVLTRLKVIRSSNHLLPRKDNGEQRGVLEVELAWPSSETTLRLLATHFDHRRSDAERLASAAMINDRTASSPDRNALLAGDLNDLPDSQTLQTLQKFWTSASRKPQPTIPVKTPRRQIDYILFRPASRWNVVETRVLPENTASDHRPVFSILEYLPQESP